MAVSALSRRVWIGSELALEGRNLNSLVRQRQVGRPPISASPERATPSPVEWLKAGLRLDQGSSGGSVEAATDFKAVQGLSQSLHTDQGNSDDRMGKAVLDDPATEVSIPPYRSRQLGAAYTEEYNGKFRFTSQSLSTDQGNSDHALGRKLSQSLIRTIRTRTRSLKRASRPYSRLNPSIQIRATRTETFSARL